LSSDSHEVHTLVARTGVLAAKAAGLPTATLFEGLPFTEDFIQHSGWIRWDELSVLAERLEQALKSQGLESQFGLLSQKEMPILAAMVGVLVTPVQLYRTQFELSRLCVRNITATFNTHRERVDIHLKLRPFDRDGSAFFRLASTNWVFAPLHLGLPESQVETEISSHEALFRVTPPHAGTLSERISRGLAGFSAAAVQQLNSLTDEFEFPNTEPRKNESDLEARLALARARWSFTERQYAVLRLVALGKSNVQIARELGCSDRTVEVHVGQMLRKLEASNRGELIARFWSD